MSLVPFLTTVIGFLPGLFKKKACALWFWDQDHWVKKAGPMSARQCRKQMATLVSMGMSEYQFRILRVGVEPPPYFDPPASALPGGKR